MDDLLLWSRKISLGKFEVSIEDLLVKILFSPSTDSNRFLSSSAASSEYNNVYLKVIEIKIFENRMFALWNEVLASGVIVIRKS